MGTKTYVEFRSEKISDFGEDDLREETEIDKMEFFCSAYKHKEAIRGYLKGCFWSQNAPATGLRRVGEGRGLGAHSIKGLPLIEELGDGNCIYGIVGNKSIWGLIL